MDDRVWVGTCTGPRDLLLVRSLFNAHDIPVVISGEHHFTLLPWYLGAFRTDVIAGAADAEDAAALLAGSRSGEHTVLDNSGSPESATENRDHASNVQPIGSSPHPWGVVATDRWHQAGMALLFGMITGFGAAHFYYTRAWVRGLALALVQLSATKVLGHSMAALGLVILARLVDVVGALWLFWYGRDEQAAFRWRRLETAERELDATRVQEETNPPSLASPGPLTCVDEMGPSIFILHRRKSSADLRSRARRTGSRRWFTGNSNSRSAARRFLAHQREIRCTIASADAAAHTVQLAIELQGRRRKASSLAAGTTLPAR